jgi:hypothetical protein
MNYNLTELTVTYIINLTPNSLAKQMLKQIGVRTEQKKTHNC